MRAALRWAALTPAVADLLRVERMGEAAGAAAGPPLRTISLKHYPQAIKALT